MAFKIGDSIVVKPDTRDPDLDADIGGWQGRITEIDEGTLCIAWDSLTLKAMPVAAIKKCEEMGWGWEQMYLLESDLAPASPRDRETDVRQAIDAIADSAMWYGFGEEGERIQRVLSGVASGDTESAMEAWKDYLDKTLTFPIDASVVELMERGPLKIGDKVVIRSLDEFIDGRAGVLAAIVHKRTRYDFPLADLQVTDRKSKNYQPIRDYVIWFANQ